MESIEKLKKTSELSDLAKLLGYRPASLSFILYKIPDAEKYTTFKIPKKDGGDREIKAPVSRLKELQRRLADLLQQCFEELYGTAIYGRALAHGFRIDHSIITNANNHRKKQYVFNVDLKDFFPSINFGRVRGLFIKSADFQLNPKVATVIAQIACHSNELPQGSPLSPVVSNLIGHILDIRLVRLAKRAKCVYSRYADDITFSTRAKDFPVLIAKQESTGTWVPSDILDAAINRAGFAVNTRKISMQYRTHRQTVTGLVVNREANIRASYYRQARAMCDSLFRTGQFYIGEEMRWGAPKNSSTPAVGSVPQLRGVLSHIYNVKKRHDDRKIQDKWKKPTAIHNLFRRFLYFDKFHNLSKPLVLCEGKTDSVYLKCALNALAAKFPTMIDVTGSEIEWKIDFFKYSKLNMDLMRFSGGTGDFLAFIAHYKTRMAPFLCSGRSFPVILLVDNDSGAKEVRKKASALLSRQVDGSDAFYHLVENIYLVLLPVSAGKTETAIEDYFELSVRSVLLDGKPFNPDKNSFDKSAHYGKHVFSDKVVKANQTRIDFRSFEPLLSRIDKAIEDYAVKLTS